MKTRIVIISAMMCVAMTQVWAGNPGLKWKEVVTKSDDNFYTTAEALRIGENVLLYQKDCGGWNKNIEIHMPLNADQTRMVQAQKSDNIATIDNDATTLEMIYLAKLYAATGQERFRDGFTRGLEYILQAQYPSGGFPQFYPIKKGYYTHITFNDDLMYNVMELLEGVVSSTKPFDLVGKQLRKRASKAYTKGIECILATQIRDKHGNLTIWCAQHDQKTLLPAKARAYELESYSGAESAGLIKLLMEQHKPTPQIVAAVNGAMRWLDQHKITNIKVEIFTNDQGQQDRRVVEAPGAPALWARFYDLDTEQPFFCDRDGVKRAQLSQIGYERRNGYGWYRTEPAKLYKMYAKWQPKFSPEYNALTQVKRCLEP